MNTQLTEIAFVLDRSGSMQSVAQAAITGFNEFLKDQQNAPGQARLTLVLFDDEILTPADHLPIAEVVPLNSDTYEPRNTTALLDAIGETIERVGKRLEQTPESERPAKVIVAILTDGQENASQKFQWKDIAALIRHQTETYKWDFIFLGANQDAIATAANLNIGAANASGFTSDAVGIRSTGSAISRKTTAMRKLASGHAVSAAEKSDLEMAMGDLVKEEDDKGRSGK